MRKIYPGGKITNDLDDLQRITYYRNGDFGYDFYFHLGRTDRTNTEWDPTNVIMYYDGDDNIFGTGFCISVTQTSASVYFFLTFTSTWKMQSKRACLSFQFFTSSHFFY
jgi:hypothetical protein